jgi:hypothetical protein
MRLIATGDGRVPTAEEYERFHRNEGRQTASDRWPSRSQLSRMYGSWLRATQAAMQLLAPQPDSQLVRTYRSQAVMAYSAHDCIRSLLDCTVDVGRRPTQSEYEAWIELSRRIDRSYGSGRRRLPNIAAIQRLLGSWAHALDAAHTWQSDGTSKLEPRDDA